MSETNSKHDDLQARGEAQHDAEPGSGGHDEHAHITPLRRLIRLLRPEASEIAIVALFSAVVGLLTLATPVAVESLVNTVAFGRMLQPIFVLCILLLTFLAFAGALRVLQAYVAELIQRRVFVRVVNDLAQRLPRARFSNWNSQRGPELLNRFFDVMTVQKSSAVLVLDGITVVLQTAIGMAVLAFYHPYLLWLNGFLLVAVALLIFVLGYGAVPTAIGESRAKYAVGAWLEELASFPVTFKGDGGAARALAIADQLTANYLEARSSHFRILMRQVVFAVGLQAVGSVFLLGLGGWLVLDGQLTLGQLVAAELIVAVIVGSFAKLGKQMESFYDLLAAVDKLGHLFDLSVERSAGATLKAVEEPAALRVRRVTYRGASGHEHLDDLSLDVRPGEMVAVCGGAGSGKSVLLDLMYGLREPTKGSIELDGLDLRSLAPPSLREQVALVRAAEIFTGTLAENVHLGRPNLDLATVRDVVATMSLFEETLDLPGGLETPLLAGGEPLSENQARRVTLARAIAGRPRLLLIDGTLDALPDRVLPQVLQSLRALRSHTTIVIVTGRDDIADASDRRLSLGSPSASRSDDKSGYAGNVTLMRIGGV